MKETDGDGIGCIIDASGVPSAVNSCFSMLRYVVTNISNYSILFIGKEGRWY